jgi:hypothetical protein
MENVDFLFAKLYRFRVALRHLLASNASARFNLPARKNESLTLEKELVLGLKRGLVGLRFPDNRKLNKAGLNQIITSGRLFDSSLGDTEVELTARGGAAWEKRASPAWDFFVDEVEPRTIRGDVWIFFEAKRRDWLVHVDQTLTRSGFFAGNERRLAALRSWRPLYWKRFDLGYSLGINTGHLGESELGKQFFEGFAIADQRLATTFSVLAGIWDAEWVTSLR